MELLTMSFFSFLLPSVSKAQMFLSVPCVLPSIKTKQSVESGVNRVWSLLMLAVGRRRCREL